MTDSIAKPLLPIAGRPLVDYLCDKIDEVDDVDAIHLVTNSRFAPDFEHWAREREGRLGVIVHDDGTKTNDDRLGAIGDIQFVVGRAGLEGEDLLVAAGDNLFDFSLAEFSAFWRERENGSCLALYEFPELEQVKQYGVVAVDADNRVVSLVEKPENPQSNLISIAVYLYRHDHVALLTQYLAEGNSADQPGRFAVWLHTRVPIYGYRFDGDWMDIGDPQQLLEADNRMRARRGLEPRDQYSPRA